MKILCVAILCVTALVLPAIATNDDCIVTIDFNKLANSTSLKGSRAYLDNEWRNDYGLALSASGGLSNKPRLFDSSNPGTNKFGDPDLGSPNERCGGPGKGEGGEPDTPGANCEPLGNVLIIQEDNDHPDIPDDNVDGGTISFHFDTPLRVDKIGLLDIDYKSYLTVKTSDSDSFDIAIPMLGDNSVQTVKINTEHVVQLDLNLRRSGAVTFLSFCYTGIGGYCGDTCKTDYCFNAVLPGGIVPAGVCSCNPQTNAGCVKPEKCAFSPLVDIGPPDCFLPMGATCLVDAECVSDHCFNDQCACNEDLDFPCTEDESCTFQEGSGYLCRSKIGQPCYGGGATCETDYCFNAVLPDGTKPAGICSCNPTTNDGCVDSEEECAFSPLIAIGPPACFLPMGATCLVDSECVSDHCFNDQCVCNEELDFPCSEQEACTFEKGSGYLCRPESQKKGIDEDCLDDSECETGNCYENACAAPHTTYMLRSYLAGFDSQTGGVVPVEEAGFLQEFTVEIQCQDPNGRPFVWRDNTYVNNVIRPQENEHVSLWSPRTEEIKENGIRYTEIDIDGALFGIDAPGLKFRIEPAYYFFENGVRVGGFCTDYFNNGVMQCAKVGDIFPDEDLPSYIVPILHNEIGWAYKRSARFWCERNDKNWLVARVSEETIPVIDEFENLIDDTVYEIIYEPVVHIE